MPLTEIRRPHSGRGWIRGSCMYVSPEMPVGNPIREAGADTRLESRKRTRAGDVNLGVGAQTLRIPGCHGTEGGQQAPRPGRFSVWRSRREGNPGRRLGRAAGRAGGPSTQGRVGFQ